MNNPETMTMAEHAEAWARDNGEFVPPRETAEWTAFYERWVEWAFSDFRGLSNDQ